MPIFPILPKIWPILGFLWLQSPIFRLQHRSPTTMYPHINTWSKIPTIRSPITSGAQSSSLGCFSHSDSNKLHKWFEFIISISRWSSRSVFKTFLVSQIPFWINNFFMEKIWGFLDRPILTDEPERTTFLFAPSISFCSASLNAKIHASPPIPSFDTNENPSF